MGDRDEGQFWSWFSETQASYADPEVSSELDRRLASLGIDGWEAGPLDADGTTMFLALSPDDKDQIARLQEFVARAPTIAGWDIRVGKPRKFWGRVFRWSAAEIDASEWRCVVLRYDDGMHEIVVLNPTIPPALVDQTQAIMEFVVESELGEIRTLEKVCKISAEAPSDAVPLEASVAIDTLDRCIV